MTGRDPSHFVRCATPAGPRAGGWRLGEAQADSEQSLISHRGPFHGPEPSPGRGHPAGAVLGGTTRRRGRRGGMGPSPPRGKGFVMPGNGAWPCGLGRPREARRGGRAGSGLAARGVSRPAGPGPEADRLRRIRGRPRVGSPRPAATPARRRRQTSACTARGRAPRGPAHSARGTPRVRTHAPPALRPGPAQGRTAMLPGVTAPLVPCRYPDPSASHPAVSGAHCGA